MISVNEWKRHYKPFHLGSFGKKVEKKTLDEAVNEQRYFEHAENALIFKRYTQRSTQQDFAENPIEFMPGDVIIKELLILKPDGLVSALKSFAKLVKARKIWVELFEEDLFSKTLLIAAGFSWRATKVSAFSEMVGLYSTWGDHDELRDEDKLTLEILRDRFATQKEIEAVRAELANVKWANHYSTYNNIKDSWTAFTLHGFSDDPTFIIKPAEMTRKWQLANEDKLDAKVRFTSAAPFFKAALKLADRIPGEKERIRLMRLAPYGGLSRHTDITDRDTGLRDGRLARLHIPITTNPCCMFKSIDYRGTTIEKHLPQGSLCYLDTRKPHAVSNDAAAERVHLVVDTWGSVALQRIALNGA